MKLAQSRPLLGRFANLNRVDDGGRFRGTAVRGYRRRRHFDFLGGSANFKADIQRTCLPNSQYDFSDNLGLKSGTRRPSWCNDRQQCLESDSTPASSWVVLGRYQSPGPGFLRWPQR